MRCCVFCMHDAVEERRGGMRIAAQPMLRCKPAHLFIQNNYLLTSVIDACVSAQATSWEFRSLLLNPCE